MNNQLTEDAARLLHNWTRAYCMVIGDPPNDPWTTAPEQQKQSARDAINFVLQNPEVSSEEMHQEWMRARKEAGWVHGPVKNEDLKTHPNLVPYDDLPPSQQTKDTFARTAIVFFHHTALD